jgi:glycosyltransferase involved in cell wall biosynthesis
MSVSAIISTYDRNDLLFGRSLASVLRQTKRVDEIVIVADDNESKWVDELAENLNGLGDPRIKFWARPHQVYPEDPGQKWCVLGLEARNFAMDVATGDWIAPLDDDDAWTDTHIEVLMNHAAHRGVDFAYGISKYVWPDMRPQFAGSWPPGYGAFCDGAQVYRNGMGYRFDPLCIARGLPEDGDLWNRMVAGGVTFSFTNQLVHLYYVNPR